jgi:hypothetical protein
VTSKRSAHEVFRIMVLAGLIGAILAVVLVSLALWIIPARAGQPFDWDRYHTRQDACREADRVGRQTLIILGYLEQEQRRRQDELTLERQVRRGKGLAQYLYPAAAPQK